ncbi:MAG TPA: hypothetical protein VL486_01910 [Verrucomicrobiae bacterium]|nr:hypothetical protein [Verrucomicrobiae bacterium]
MAISISSAVAQASEQPVINAAARLGNPHATWPFLPPSSNVTDRKALAFAESKYNQVALTATEKNEFAEYLALSTSCHALDGWRYLSQAGLAMLRGARNEALHLAYYAELRGALSLLAGSGIGILNRKHFAINGAGDVVWIKMLNTHVAAWEALAGWARSTTNAKRVVEALVVFGFTGLEWAEACSAVGSPDAIAQHWLQNWSIDLNILMNDKDARNEASYRPDLRVPAMNSLSRKELAIVRDVNAACNPIAYGAFEEVDIALLHDLCLKACEVRFLPPAQDRLHRMLSEVFRWLTVIQGINSGDTLRMIRAVKRAPLSSGGSLIAAADGINSEPIAVFSRAFLLLRLASALKRRFWMNVNGLVHGGVARWQGKLLHHYGEHSNLWERANAPTDFMQLDADRVTAEDDLDKWMKDNQEKPFSPYRLWKEQGPALTELCRFERIGILAVAQ